MMTRMPKGRDIRVLRPEPSHADAVAGADVATSVATPELVTVMGFGKDDVLFRTYNANIIQVRDSNGVIAAMLVRLKPGIWGFSRRGDPDWEENLGLYGSEDKGA
jgi:hypothetical protein